MHQSKIIHKIVYQIHKNLFGRNCRASCILTNQIQFRRARNSNTKQGHRARGSNFHRNISNYYRLLLPCNQKVQ